MHNLSKSWKNKNDSSNQSYQVRGKKKRGVDGKSTFRILTEHWMQRVVFFFSDHTAIFVQLVSPTKYTTQVGRWFWILELRRRHSSVRVVNASVGLETWALYQKNSDFDFSFLQPACCVISFGCRKSKQNKQANKLVILFSTFHLSFFEQICFPLLLFTPTLPEHFWHRWLGFFHTKPIL